MTVDNKFIVHANIPSHTALFENYDYSSSFQTQLKQIRLYKKIKESPIQFNYIDQGGQK